jgi:hypothetical protein
MGSQYVWFINIIHVYRIRENSIHFLIIKSYQILKKEITIYQMHKQYLMYESNRLLKYQKSTITKILEGWQLLQLFNFTYIVKVNNLGYLQFT